MADNFMRLYRAAVRTGLRPWRKHVSVSLPIMKNGRRFHIPVLDGIEMRGTGEAWKGHAIARLLALRPGPFVDVGVNLGQTLLDLRAADLTRPYFGFEPNPVCVHYVTRFAEINGFDHNSNVIAAGLASAPSVAMLRMVPGEPTDEAATTVDSFRPNRNATKLLIVPLLQLDTLWPALGQLPVGVCKIDVEGAETEVLNGMIRIMKEDRPFILCEVLPAARGSDMSITAARYTRLRAVLESVDYAVLSINKHADGRYAGADLCGAFPLEYWSPEKQDAYDYMFVAAESVDTVIRALGG